MPQTEKPKHEFIQRSREFGPQTFFLAMGDRITTGSMSDCATVVVLCARNDNEKRYTMAVGQHGSGGIGNVDMNGIIAEVPEHYRTRSLVYIAPGSNARNESSYFHSKFSDAKDLFEKEGFTEVVILEGHDWTIFEDTGEYTQSVA